MTAPMYAQLGNVVFGLTGPIVAMGAQHGYTYVEHAVIEGKPRLQSLGDALQRITLDLVFTHGVTDPVEGMRALRAAAAAHEALPLLLAGGELRGRFVIESIEERVAATDAGGVPVHVEARVQLVEWVEQPQPAAGTAAGTVRSGQGTPAATRSRQRGRAQRTSTPPPAVRPPPQSVPPAQITRRDRPQFNPN